MSYEMEAAVQEADDQAYERWLKSRANPDLLKHWCEITDTLSPTTICPRENRECFQVSGTIKGGSHGS